MMDADSEEINSADGNYILSVPHLIIAFAVGLFLLLSYENIYINTASAVTPGGYYAGVLTSAVFSTWLLLGGYWVTRSSIPPQRYRRIGIWVLVATVIFTTLIGGLWLTAVQLSPISIVSTLRWGASVGGGLGLIVGVFDARALEKAFEAGVAQRKHKEVKDERDRLDNFASIVSHDLRNPLNVAQGHLELAAQECDSDHLDTVSRSHDRMEVLIEDLLVLARAGQSISETDKIDLATVANTSWDNIDSQSADLAVASTETIPADRSRLQQLFENLFRNAIEHGGTDVTITVGSVSDGFYVEDDGEGIPKEERDDVLEAGYTSSDDGTGFGLSIVSDIANAHGWRVTVTEGTEGGARFEFTDVQFA